jgi:hypothetical protein
MMLFTDPPDHTRLRALANRAFIPRRVEALWPRIAAIVDAQLADLDQGGWDLIEGLAYPLPVMVIAEILSLPGSDRESFKQWSDDVIAVAAGVGDDPARRERGLRRVPSEKEPPGSIREDPFQRLILRRPRSTARSALTPDGFDVSFAYKSHDKWHSTGTFASRKQPERPDPRSARVTGHRC